MDFVTLINILEDDLTRDCIVYKSSNNMQKTATYHSLSDFQIVVNSNCNISKVNQIFFIQNDNDLLVYFEKLLDNEVRDYEVYNINEISSLEVMS